MRLNNIQIKEGLLSGDTETFRQLYKMFGGLVVGYVKKNNGTEEDARELVQVVMLELWKAAKEGRYDEQGKLDRFVYRLTANTWRDELRRRKVRRVDSLEGGAQAVADDQPASLAVAIVKDQRIEAIHHCLQLLESPCDDIIKLYHLEEVSLQEVAQRLRYDYNNLRKRIFDCRKKLKKLVDQYLKHTSASDNFSA